MGKVCFQPYYAIKYIKDEPKEFVHSLARPKPVLEKGDVVIVDKRTAFNLVQKGFGEFEMVDSIEIASSDEADSVVVQEIETLLHTVPLPPQSASTNGNEGGTDDDTTNTGGGNEGGTDDDTPNTGDGNEGGTNDDTDKISPVKKATNNKGK